MRLALVVPPGRSWAWVSALAERLGSIGTVEVRYGEGPPPLCLMRAILALERGLSRNAQDLLAPRSDQTNRSALGELEPFDLVINLTGRPLVSNAPEVLEVLYDGDPNERSLLARIVAGGPPLLSVCGRERAVLAASLPAMPDSHRLGPLLASVHARVTALVLRAVEQTRFGQPPRSPISVDRPRELYSNKRLLAWTVARTARALLRRLSRQGPAEDPWMIAIRRFELSWVSSRTAGFAVVDPGAACFQADPFLVVENGRTYLFAEEFRRKEGRGAIVWAELRDGVAPEFRPALERPYHLAYPFVFRHEGQLYMLPEAAESGRVELYRCDRFPDGWSLAQVLLEDTRLVDPTLLQWGGLWWLFGVVSNLGESTHDELFAYSASGPFGPWTPHPANPLKSDVRSSRPAGRFIERDARLLRPAQDCQASYGAALVWCEVIELSPTTYREREIGRWCGPDFGAFDGVHTYDAVDGWEVIDSDRIEAAVSIDEALQAIPQTRKRLFRQTDCLFQRRLIRRNARVQWGNQPVAPLSRAVIEPGLEHQHVPKQIMPAPPSLLVFVPKSADGRWVKKTLPAKALLRQ